MLTAWQRGLVLNLWVDIRERKGEEYDVRRQIRFNWPSVSDEEVEEIMDCYLKRREIMKAVSSPNTIPKHVIRCELGWRLYIEAFAETGTAKLFLDKMLEGADPLKWTSATELRGRGGVLVVKCEELEDILESPTPKGSLPDNFKNQINAFLRGHWDKKVPEEKVRPSVHLVGTKKVPARVAVATGGLVSVQDIAARNKWEARAVRSAMRKAGWKRPLDGWCWPADEALVIEKKLKEMMK